MRRHCQDPIFGKAAIKEGAPGTPGHDPDQVGARIFVQYAPTRRAIEWRPHAESRAFARGLRAKFINVGGDNIGHRPHSARPGSAQAECAFAGDSLE